MTFQYKMVQVPPNISIELKNHKGNEAASYLENIVNELAAEGWEFYRTDNIGVEIQPGCFDALFGKRSTISTYYVITFRKEI